MTEVRRALIVFMSIWVIGWFVIVAMLFISLDTFNHRADGLTRHETEQLTQNRRLIQAVGAYLLCVDEGRAPESCHVILEEAFGK